jgi:hypothetical protein
MGARSGRRNRGTTTMKEKTIIEEVEGFYRIIPLSPLRKTPKVTFDNVPMGFLPRIDAIDRVLHEGGAISPGAVGEVARPWYMHLFQDDNLIVLAGVREVDLYAPDHGRMETFTVTPNEITKAGRPIYQGGAMLVWPAGVFHRIRTGEAGSASLNFAVHYAGYDPRTNFNIYDLDPQNGAYWIVRDGYLDQPITGVTLTDA